MTKANEPSAAHHGRMLVILDPEHYDLWPTAADTTIPMALLQPYPAEKMRVYPVAKRVSNPRNDDADLIAKIAP